MPFVEQRGVGARQKARKIGRDQSAGRLVVQAKGRVGSASGCSGLARGARSLQRNRGQAGSERRQLRVDDARAVRGWPGGVRHKRRLHRHRSLRYNSTTLSATSSPPVALQHHQIPRRSYQRHRRRATKPTSQMRATPAVNGSARAPALTCACASSRTARDDAPRCGAAPLCGRRCRDASGVRHADPTRCPPLKCGLRMPLHRCAPAPC